MGKSGKYGDYTVNPKTGTKYLKRAFVHGITLGGKLIKGTVVFGITRTGKLFHQVFPGDGSQYGTDSKGNAYYKPSRRK